MPYLAVETGTNAGSKHTVAADSVILGRGPGTIQVEDKAASRRHAEIFRVGELCFIRDLESKNGTYLNEAKIREEILKSGDRIRIGSTVYLFADEDAEGLAEAVQFGDDKGKGETTFVSVPSGKKNLPVREGEEGERLEILRKAAQTLTEIHDRAELRKAVLSVLADAVRAKFAYFFIPDAEAGGFKGLAQCGDTESVSVSRSILRYAQKMNQPVMTEDATSDDRFKGNQSVMLRKIHSVLCVPLGRGKTPAALIYMGRDLLRNPFTEREMHFAALVGDIATLALEAVSVQESQQEMLLTTARTLVRALEMGRPEMQGHSERVASASLAIARAMGLPFEQCRRIQIGGLLHDIGRLSTGKEDGKGSFVGTRESADREAADAEARHVTMGEQLVAQMPGLADILPAVSYHHERSDGSGFPRGVKGNKIPVMGRIVAVANELDHLITRGGDQGTGILLKDALLALGQAAGKSFDTEVVKALLVAYRRGTLHVDFAPVSS